MIWPIQYRRKLRCRTAMKPRPRSSIGANATDRRRPGGRTRGSGAEEDVADHRQRRGSVSEHRLQEGPIDEFAAFCRRATPRLALEPLHLDAPHEVLAQLRRGEARA